MSEKALRVAQTMQLERQADGNWRAFYPLEEWSVTSPSRVKAFRIAAAELARRGAEPGYGERERTKALRHLHDPIPGLEVEELDETAYRARMGSLDHIAEQVMASMPPDIRTATEKWPATWDLWVGRHDEVEVCRTAAPPTLWSVVTLCWHQLPVLPDDATGLIDEKQANDRAIVLGGLGDVLVGQGRSPGAGDHIVNGIIEAFTYAVAKFAGPRLRHRLTLKSSQLLSRADRRIHRIKRVRRYPSEGDASDFPAVVDRPDCAAILPAIRRTGLRRQGSSETRIVETS